MSGGAELPAAPAGAAVANPYIGLGMAALNMLGGAGRPAGPAISSADHMGGTASAWGDHSGMVVNFGNGAAVGGGPSWLLVAGIAAAVWFLARK